jgi:hypothetical protein
MGTAPQSRGPQGWNTEAYIQPQTKKSRDQRPEAKNRNKGHKAPDKKGRDKTVDRRPLTVEPLSRGKEADRETGEGTGYNTKQDSQRRRKRRPSGARSAPGEKGERKP